MRGIDKWAGQPGYRNSFEYARACEWGFNEAGYRNPRPVCPLPRIGADGLPVPPAKPPYPVVGPLPDYPEAEMNRALAERIKREGV